MPIISDTQLGKDIRSSNIQSCYFLYGKEKYNIEKAVSALIHKVVGSKNEDLQVDRFEDGASVSDIYLAVSSVTLFSGSKCTVVHDLSIAKLSEEEIELLIDTVSVTEEQAVLILYFTEQQPDSKAAKVKKLMDAFAAKGAVTCFAPKDNLTLRRQVQELCKKNGVSIDAAGADALVSRFGADGFHLRNESEKMISYALARAELNPEEKNAVITASDVDFMCIDTVENTVFDLTDAILGGNHRRVFGLLERLFTVHIEGLSITGALTLSFTDLYRARLALDAGVSAKQVATDFAYPAKREFIVARSFARAERYSARQLRQCFEILTQTTGNLMGSKSDERLLVERMIAKMLTVMAGTKR